LRYFRSGRKANHLANPNVQLRNDLEYLKLNWAISSPVNKLCRYAMDNRFELQASTENIFETDDVHVKGRIDAVKTVLQRNLSGHPTKVAYYSSNKSFNSGPNRVLAWVLNNAYNYGRRWVEVLEKSEKVWSDHHRKIGESISLLNAVRKASIIKDAFGAAQSNRRPSRQELLQAKMSRRILYQLAYKAYIFFEGLEKGDMDCIRDLLEETLIKPKEDYQVFELALAMCMAETIGRAVNQPVVLKEITANGNLLILEVGDIAISWQSHATTNFSGDLEPSELKLLLLLPEYNLYPSIDRPDIIVLFKPTQMVLAIGEAKFFSVRNPDSWRSPLRQALAQIIRYSRRYARGQKQNALISRSCIALSQYPEINRPAGFPENGPIVLDDLDLYNFTTEEWARRVLAPLSAQPADASAPDPESQPEQESGL
jgi:hypothetical protein